jgi:hypothetical protein
MIREMAMNQKKKKRESARSAQNSRFFRESGAQSGDWALSAAIRRSIAPWRSLLQTPLHFTPSAPSASMGPSKPRGKRLAFPSKRAHRDVSFAQNGRFEASFSRDSISQDRESSFKRV